MNAKRRKELIMEHYLNPRFKKDLGEKYKTFYSNRCADELKVQIEYKEDKLKNIYWDGKGCAIFQASTDLFVETIENKEKTVIENIFKRIFKNAKWGIFWWKITRTTCDF